MKRRSLVITLILGLALMIPQSAQARAVHYFSCADCHRSGMSLFSLVTNNLCLKCHSRTGDSVSTNDPAPDNIAWPNGRFNDIDASNAMGSHPTYNPVTATATSHMWAVMSESNPAAGAQSPTLYKYQFDGRYGVSRGKVICNRCHNPHGVDTYDKKILKVDNSRDQMCRDCHLPWATSDPSAFETHPVVADYAAAADPAKFNTTYNTATGLLGANVGQGEVRLVYNSVSGKYMVSCTSCHGVHFADSNSDTADGVDNYNYNSVGDGNLLRSDGIRPAGQTASDYTAAAADTRSNLCLACHTYKPHGKTADGGWVLGCLDCHGGHSYNGGDPFHFILKKSVFNPIYNAVVLHTGYENAGTHYQYNSISSTLLANKTKVYNDGSPATANGYCETCHGNATGIPKGASGWHTDLDDCYTCHPHNLSTGIYSFQNDSNAESCGDCHGFPPHLNERGDRYNLGTYGGYAYDPATNWNYGPDPNFKQENQTAHLSHAGYNSTYLNYYAYSTCDVCHGASSGMNAAHNTNSGNYDSFRDVPFDGIAKPSGLNPLYDVSGPDSWTCTDVYCHSNGGPRNTLHTRIYNAGVIRTPAWDLASGGGLNHLIGAADQNVRCSSCHGNSATLMSTRGNSSAHGKHLDAGITCDVCHAETATSTTSLVAGATDVKNGGKHVNGSINVVLSTSAVNGGLDPADYDSAQGACATYCHDFAGLVPLIDWQNDTTACGDCHGVTATTLTSGSHARHLDSSKANVSCDECHGLNASTGNHTGHVDGVVTKLATSASCDVCHGVETASGESWDVSPTWGMKDSVHCETCHTGAVLCEYPTTSPTVIAPDKSLAVNSGHNYNSTTVSYASGNTSAKKLCTDCHITIDDTGADGHVDGLGNGDILQAGFSCEACHTTGGSRAGEAGVKVATHDNTNPSYSLKNGAIGPFTKLCVACHDPHGTSNWAMIWDDQNKQHDKDATDNFSGNVVFQSKGGTGTDQDNSYDESGDTVVNVDNADDICATCHTITDHNRQDLTGVDTHHENETCTTTCHTHDASVGGFMATGGNSCDSCHDNPPRAGYEKYGKYGTTFGAHDQHTWVATIYNSEDTSDCGVCHPGAENYDYGHANNTMDLAAGIVTLGGGNYRCTDLNSGLGCHQSSATDGYWTDTTDYVGNGLNCTACHNNGTNDNVLANAAQDTGAHTEHIGAGKTCSACHGTVPTDYIHIHVETTSGPSDDGAALRGMAAAVYNEATVVRPSMSYDQGVTNTCVGGIDLGCHNAKTAPDWRTYSPIVCTDCHDPAGGATADPKSGLHNISAVAVAAGVQQHDSNLATNGCTECHNATKPASHANATWQADQANNTESRFLARSGLVFDDSLGSNASTCFDNGASGTGSLDQASGCHSDNGVWKRRWSTEANSTSTASGSSRCNVCHGQFSSLTNGAGWTEGTSHAGTFGGIGSNRGDTHNSLSGEDKACEDCHAYATQMVNHKNGNVTMNDDIGVTDDTEVTVGTGVYCAHCHTDGDPAASGTYTFAVSSFPLQKVAGANDPVEQCNSCHGQGGGGRFWPVDASMPAADPRNDAGRHEIHMTRLAVSVMGQNVAQLLTNNAGVGTPPWDTATTEEKQKELCSYCHDNPGYASHWDADGGLPAEVNGLYNLWDKGADLGTNWAGTKPNCSNVNCHNGKATSATANFDWYGTGTGNCALCHNDITDTTAGTTGETHQAHLAVPTFGKTISCGSCHGGSPSWDSDGTPDTYSVPSGATHINGQFKVEGGSVIDGPTYSYDGAYTDAATRTPGSCGVNLCHNNGKNAATAAYTWQTAKPGCTACHETSSALGESHPAHLNAKPNYGLTISCPDCHEAVSASNMTGMSNHMNGEVTLAGGISYTGIPSSLDVTVVNTWGQCDNSVCHKQDATTAVNSPTWGNVAATACAICHNDGGSNPYPDTGRHGDHVPNAAYVTSSCGNCHAGAGPTQYNSVNHLDASVETGNDITVHSEGSPTCTNNCHVVDATGNWGDTAALDCVECHTTGTIADAKGALPASGLHAVTPTVSATTHDGTLQSGNCVNCHLYSGPTDSHLNGILNNSGNASFYFNSVTVAGYNSAGCQATCHSDSGDWKRKWSATAANSDGGECANCHGGIGTGYTASTWVDGIAPDHTYNWDGDSDAGNPEVVTKHSVCKTCHGFNGPTDMNANYNVATMHRNSKITLNGGTSYNSTNYGCDNAGCHGDYSDGHHLDDSGWEVELGSFGSGASCFGCHGNGSDQYWPDGSSSHEANDNPGAHAVHVAAIADEMDGDGTKGPGTGTLNEKNTTCDYCHPGNTHGGADGAVPADVSQTDTDGSYPPAEAEPGTYFKYIIGGVVDNNAYYNLGSNTCSTVKCHAGAPYTPSWYPDVTPPASIGELVSYNSAVGYNSVEPGQILLTWLAPGNDGDLDQVAYRYDVRMRESGSGAIDAANFDASPKVGGVPTVHRYNKAEVMVVDGLDTDLSYSFAVKTADADGNWSNISNVPPAIKPHADDVKPDFSGVGTARAADAGAAANLHWEQAKDHSPVTYDIFYADVSTGIDYGTPQVSDFAGISYQVTGLQNNKVYEFAVRAKDDHGNAESNTIVAAVMPEAPPTIDYDPTVTYYFSGANSIGAARSTSGSPVTIASGASNVWTRSTTYGVDTDVSGGSLVVYVKDDQGGGSTDANLRVELGYGNFSTFSPPVTVDMPIGKKSARVVTVKFNGAGGMVPQGQGLAVRLSSTGSGPLAISYGDASTQGDLFVKERIYNHSPSPVAFSAQPSGGGEVLIDWGSPSTDQDGHAVHYDVYGSIDDGATYPYIIATDLLEATTSVSWDTQTDHIHTGAAATVRVKVEPGDPYSHSSTVSNAWAVDNSVDSISPAAPADLLAQMRPKQGSVYLTWIAPGDDNGLHGAAASYDIRYAQSDINNEADWLAATPVTDPPTLSVPPVPQFAKTRQHLEVLGLDPGTLYYFAIRAVDEAGNISPIGTSPVNSAKGGPKCGHCHSTPPDSDANAGNHSKHGYTLEECATCHGDMTGITGAHQDGNLVFGFGAAGSHTGFVSGSDIVYTNNGQAMGSGGDFIIYHDDGADSGSGGFNPTGGDGTDNGTCSNFTASGVDAFGCHSSATPKWDHSEKLACGACHGDVGRTDDWYTRPYDATTANGGEVPDEIKASPPIDNHGNDGQTGGVDQKKYVGAHEKHLNYSFRFSKGNSCNLCHKGSEHANGDVDINLDPDVVGAGADYTPSSAGVAATCGSLDPNACHDAGPAPEWQAGVTFACNNCHGFGGSDPSHVSDRGARACTYCHPAGHPSGTPSGTFLIPNNPTVGINYSSGGIHIYNSIGGGPYGTEAEICWGCHDLNGVSEWNGDDVVSPGTANTTAAGPDYNFGSLDQTNWVGATWSSSEAMFAYKQGLIQSTHTTGLGSSAVTGSDYNYTEAPDAVGLIRCTNCHDVHNRNLALGDNATGNPYLRGSWRNNPYLEDGAPRSTSTYAELAPTGTATLGFGQVPRGGAGHAELGGFQIDQNNGGSPTGGWTLDDSAGLCTLCHGRDVNNMDQLADVQNLWLSNNGHANAAIGGDGTGRADILNFTNRHNLNLPSDFTGSGSHAGNPTMGYANALAERVYGWRSAYNGAGWEWPTLPQVGGTSASGQGYCGLGFDWGVIQDNGTAEKGYHSFSCSKCHNPHASRLPKLMITNCLDTQHNKWDDSKTLPSTSDANPDYSNIYPSDENGGKTMSQATSAQNCHRYGDPDPAQLGTGPGWNKVTPWPKANEPAAP